MMLSVAMVLVLAGAPIRVAVPALPEVKGAELGERLAEQLADGGGIDAVTPAGIATLLGDADTLKLIGCNGGRACLLRAAKTLSADFLLVGRPIEQGIAVELIIGKSGDVLMRWQAPQVDDGFISQIAKEARLALVPPEPKPGQKRSPLRWVPIALGAVALGSGIGLYVHAFSQHRRLVNGDPSINSAERAESVAASGHSIETTSWLRGGVGVALIAGGIAFALLAPESDVTVGLGWSGGPVVGFTGRL
jgi:hypothetical protein